MEFSTLVHFSKLVSDSPTSESISTILAETVVLKCGVPHALVFGTNVGGEFTMLSSYGACGGEFGALDLKDVESIGVLRSAVLKACAKQGYGFRPFPLISNTGLFGLLGVLYLESAPPEDAAWTLMEGLTELTAISLNKTYQHQKLQKAFDDLRASQEVLVRTEKFRALGQMSAGIAHDLKNLLNPLMLYTDEIRDAAGDREEVLDVVARIDRILQRGVETTERLREFSRLSPEQSEAVATDLNDMLREALEISKPRLSGVKVARELGTSPKVLLRPADCVTAIVNLLFNAADALQGKGTITVRTGSLDGGAWIEVADDGPGMTAEIRNRIIEPLFTTKGQQGTGLGVSIVYAFAQRHGGRLDIESEPGKGATFRLWFPAGRRISPRQDS